MVYVISSITNNLLNFIHKHKVPILVGIINTKDRKHTHISCSFTKKYSYILQFDIYQLIHDCVFLCYVEYMINYYKVL